jgi:hypothetical protein
VADVVPTDVVSPQNQDIGFSVRHCITSLVLLFGAVSLCLPL